jgi:lipoate-protein ligase A
VTARPASLFDVEPLRRLARSTLGVLRSAEAVIVIGSRQPGRDLDEGALERDGIGIRRRHGGGGAVLLRTADRWVELWLRAATGTRVLDVRSSAYLVGEWWRAALGAHGVDADVHRGAVLGAPQGAVACFAGIGPGELTVRGHKVLGISQWRVREGVLVSSVLAVEPPGDLERYLSPGAATVPRLRSARSILAAAPELAIDAVLATFVELVSASDPSVALDNQPFA